MVDAKADVSGTTGDTGGDVQDEVAEGGDIGVGEFGDIVKARGVVSLLDGGRW